MIARYSEEMYEFLSENFHFLVVKFSVHLNRLVFVMLGGKVRRRMIRR